MLFALLGDHPDGLDMARALADSGRHELRVYSGPPAGFDLLNRWGLRPTQVGDLEEILADPAIGAVIVAGSSSLRPAQLRRALQSERHTLCVHPADDTPDIGYEAALLQSDVHCVLLPLMPEALHPGIQYLAQLARAQSVPELAPATGTDITALAPTAIARTPTPVPRSALSGQTRLIEIERWSTDEIVLSESSAESALPCWDIFRLLGGEIAEVYAQAGQDDLDPQKPVLIAGHFLDGGLFQGTYLPFQAENRLRLALVTPQGRAELIFPQGHPGPAHLSYLDDAGQNHQHSWDVTNPWLALVDTFDTAVAVSPTMPTHSLAAEPPLLAWHDAQRALELDDAARRSIRRGRASTLEYQEAAEEASFKGSMTLLGCSMLWLCLVLLIFSIWVPWLAWPILPLLGLFLLLHAVLSYFGPKKKGGI